MLVKRPHDPWVLDSADLQMLLVRVLEGEELPVEAEILSKALREGLQGFPREEEE